MVDFQTGQPGQCAAPLAVREHKLELANVTIQHLQMAELTALVLVLKPKLATQAHAAQPKPKNY